MAELEHLGGKRAESARARRAEQLRRWRRSQTEQEPAERQPRTRRGGPRVRFEDGAVFLAACSSGDTDEVRRLLARGADVDTANVDGLTALHQVGARDARGAPPRPGLSWLLGTGPGAVRVPSRLRAGAAVGPAPFRGPRFPRARPRCRSPSRKERTPKPGGGAGLRTPPLASGRVAESGGLAPGTPRPRPGGPPLSAPPLRPRVGAAPRGLLCCLIIPPGP